MKAIKLFLGLFAMVLIGTASLPAIACTPDCAGKQCGDDGCGGSCGTCKAPAQCVVDQCVRGCGAFGIPITRISCCYKGYALQCGYDERKDKFVWDAHKCKSEDECRWDKLFFVYECDPTLPDYEDPQGKQPRKCNFECKPDCNGKNCGPDGCGGTCGDCDGVCLNGICCHPDCDGKNCGPDGCGGTCGKCDSWAACENGKCVSKYGCKISDPGCPDCACRECVCAKDNNCCTWSWNDKCVKLCRDECGGCKKCVPDCTGKQCGPDGCDGLCGHCQAGDTCKDGKCVKCVPDCTGKECGDDGCGGSCGECQPNVTVCDHGKCRPCDQFCSIYAECGRNDCNTKGCGGECRENYVCIGQGCYYCYHYCTDRECGDDGCGRSCGTCGPCKQCVSHHCKPIPDCVAPDTGPEPVPDAAEYSDIAESVDIAEPDHEKTDAKINDTKPATDAKTGKDTQKLDVKSPKDTKTTDKSLKNDQNTAVDTGSSDVISAKPSSSGGCTTSGTGNLPYWVFLLFAPLLYLRKRT